MSLHVAGTSKVSLQLKAGATTSTQTAPRLLRASCCIRDMGPRETTTPAATSPFDMSWHKRATSCLVIGELRALPMSASVTGAGAVTAVRAAADVAVSAAVASAVVAGRDELPDSPVGPPAGLRATNVEVAPGISDERWALIGSITRSGTP